MIDQKYEKIPARWDTLKRWDKDVHAHCMVGFFYHDEHNRQTLRSVDQK